MDLDGTLIGSDLVISDVDRAAIARAVETGIHVVLVTGRLFSASRPFALDLGLHGPLAGLQGGVVYDVDSGELLHATPLSASVALAAYDALQPKDYDLQLYFGDTLYLDHMSAASAEYLRLSRVEPVMVPDLRSLLTGAPPAGALIKLLAIGAPDAVADEIAPLSAILGAGRKRLPEPAAITSRSPMPTRTKVTRLCASRPCWASISPRASRSAIPTTMFPCSAWSRKASRSRTRPRRRKKQRLERSPHEVPASPKR